MCGNLILVALLVLNVFFADHMKSCHSMEREVSFKIIDGKQMMYAAVPINLSVRKTFLESESMSRTCNRRVQSCPARINCSRQWTSMVTRFRTDMMQHLSKRFAELDNQLHIFSEIVSKSTDDDFGRMKTELCFPDLLRTCRQILSVDVSEWRKNYNTSTIWF